MLGMLVPLFIAVTKCWQEHLNGGRVYFDLDFTEIQYSWWRRHVAKRLTADLWPGKMAEQDEWGHTSFLFLFSLFCPHRHKWRCVSWMIPNPVNVTMQSNCKYLTQTDNNNILVFTTLIGKTWGNTGFLLCFIRMFPMGEQIWTCSFLDIRFLSLKPFVFSLTHFVLLCL